MNLETMDEKRLNELKQEIENEMANRVQKEQAQYHLKAIRKLRVELLKAESALEKKPLLAAHFKATQDISGVMFHLERFLEKAEEAR